MSTFISQTMVECLGWTLVHFIWQGFAIAAVLAIVLRLLRGKASHQRYLVGCLALVLMAITPIVTFRVVGASYAEEPATAVTSVLTSVPPGSALLNPSSSSRIVVTARQSVRSRSFAQRIERIFPWMVLGWSLGVLALSCRLLGGWLQVERLRRHGVSVPMEDWHQRMAILSQRLDIHRPVQLLQSALVEVPTVIGWLRPMILLPASCIVGLTSAQLESILAHELAHIRRHDYLVNLLQSVVETVLFYHPAVWWVSRRVREERENCCDDLAVEVCGDRAVYARALATLETLRLTSAPLALGASGSPLLPRIRRLAGHSSKDVDRSGWPIAGIVVLILTAMLAVGLRGNRALADENKATNAPPKIGTRLDKILKPGKLRKIDSKLNSIEVDSIQFDHVPLWQVIRQVSELAKSLDPQHEGINFLLEPSIQYPTNSAKIDPATGLPEGAVRVDIKDAKVTIDPPLHHLRMTDVLDAIVRCADQPLRYSVSDYAVVFSPKQPGAFETRTFHVDPNTFRQGLQGTLSKPVGNPAGNTNGAPSPGAVIGQPSSNAVVVQAQIRRFFDQAGADWSTNNPANAGKMFVWNDRTGILLVRSTSEDLARIENAIQAMNSSLKKSTTNSAIRTGSLLKSGKEKAAPQTVETNPAYDPVVNVKMQLVEINALKLGAVERKNLEQLVPGFSLLNQASASPSPPTMPVVESGKTNITFSKLTNTIVVQTSGVLTGPQSKETMHRIEQMAGSTILTTPEATLPSGHQAELMVGEITTIVTSLNSSRNEKGEVQDTYQTEALPFGPIVDLVPRVSSNGKTIDLDVVASVTEFVGYADPRQAPKGSPQKPAFSRGVMPLPQYRLRQLTGDATVADGGTIVLSGLEAERVTVVKDKVSLLGDLPLVGGLFRSTSTSKTQNFFIVFITPTIMNKVHGIPVHPDKVASDTKQPTRL